MLTEYVMRNTRIEQVRERARLPRKAMVTHADEGNAAMTKELPIMGFRTDPVAIAKGIHLFPSRTQ